MPVFSRLTIFFLGLVTSLAFAGAAAEKPLTGTLEIHFQLAAATDDDLQPSYQTTVWLQDAEGKLVRSLLVSEWLAYSGHNKGIVCPTWLAIADWGNVSEEELDAIAQATPDLGDSVVKLELGPLGLAPGRYVYGVETHVAEEANIVFEGELELGTAANESVATRRYTPKAFPGAEEVLAGVRASYQP